MQTKTCFVIAPIGEPGSETRRRSDLILRFVISPATKRCGYIVIRADEISEPGIMITTQIIQHIIDVPLVIADLTERNPNVFYELAIRHALKKPVIQIITKGEQIPFDIAGTRTIQVDHHDLDSVEAAINEIVHQINVFEKGSGNVETPISVALDLKSLKRSDDPVQRSLADLVSSISDIRKSLMTIEERQEQKTHLDRIERESLQLALISMIEPLAAKISGILTKDVRWASEALEKAKLGPYTHTLFDQRLDHFRDEKEHIAERFLPFLLRHCQALVSADKKVFLIIDSGTTLYPFFKKLGEQAIHYTEDGENLFRELVIVTNNLAGIQTLMDSGRVNPNYRYSPLAVTCKLLPGNPLPIYSAVTGKETNEALLRLRSEEGKSRNCVFIGLVTGNWVRLRRTHPVCPVPLARGVGHREFKQTLVNVSDEIYVISPLGKVFVNASEDEVNRALGFNENLRDPDRSPYHDVSIDSKKASSVKLVSTSRLDGRVLSNHSQKVQEALQAKDASPDYLASAQLKIDTPIFITFDKLPNDWFEQAHIEFPHSYTRRQRELMGKYFSVPRVPIREGGD